MSRIEFEYENEMKKTMDSSQIERLDAAGYKIEDTESGLSCPIQQFFSPGNEQSEETRSGKTIKKTGRGVKR